MEDFKSEPFFMKVSGDYALFTDPMSKGGGEKFTYQVPTYQALKGITEANYWKPTIYYLIDEVKVMRTIKTETKGILSPMKNGSKDLNYNTYLKDVEYLIKFHFEWNTNRGELEFDRDRKKHEQILLRSMQRGGRRDIFLGTRECIGHIERIRESEYMAAKSPFKGENISFGIMFHSFVYPGETYNKDAENVLMANFCPINMADGIISFPEPKDCNIKHNLGSYTIRDFNKTNMMSVEKELKFYDDEEVNMDGINV